MAIKVLKTTDLKKMIRPGDLKFNNTRNIKALDGIIGQDRAMRAIQLALEMDFSGYNIFVTGKGGTGRTTILQDLLQKYSKNKPEPDDWCYVYNFKDPDYPRVISLPPRKGCQFQKDMEKLLGVDKELMIMNYWKEGLKSINYPGKSMSGI